MREIKCRGKRVDTGEWVTGYYVCVGEKYHYIYTGKLDLCKDHPCLEGFQVDPETVGQFTGYIDKTGKEIYEDDVIKVENYLICEYEDADLIDVVIFCEGQWYITEGEVSLHELCDYRK